jgi:hypothetical protein
MTPNKTLYVRDGDADVWEAAEKLAGGSLSQLVTQLLRDHVASQSQTEPERIVVPVLGADGESERDVAFWGRWIVGSPGDDDFRAGTDAGACWAVALTKKGQLAVYSWHCNGRWGPYLNVYADVDHARRVGLPEELLAEVGGQLGMVEELDI